MNQQKFDYAFACLDQNGTGTLDHDDFFQLGDALRKARGWTDEAPEYQRIRSALDDFWQLMLLCVDVDGSGEIDREEFTVFEQMMADQTREFGGQPPPWVLELFLSIFEALDVDGDGQISVEEYRMYLGAMGSSMDPDQAFKRLDLDSSGFIEVSELEELLAQYFTSADSADPGHFLVTGGWPEGAASE